MLTFQQQEYLYSGFGRPLHIPLLISGLISGFYVTWRMCQNCGETNELSNISKCAGKLEDGQCDKEVCFKCTVALTYNDDGVGYNTQMFYHSDDCLYGPPQFHI
eukprot:223839_1